MIAMDQPKNTTELESDMANLKISEPEIPMHPQQKTYDFDEGWSSMEAGFEKLKIILKDRDSNVQFSSGEYMKLYTTIYNLCTSTRMRQKDYSEKLYDGYRRTLLQNYVSSTGLPLLREKNGEFVLRELVLRWSNHKIMVRWLSRFFSYLDRFYIERNNLPTLNHTGIITFRDIVYDKLNGKFTDAVISLIDQERDGEKIDRALLKNVVDFFVEIGVVYANAMEFYTNDFEKAMIEDTAAYYSRKASTWIVQDSCPEYMVKAEECLKREKDRAAHYLHSTSENPLLETVQHELLTVVSSQLLEKENSGCRALLRDDKVDDLSRMYRLYSKIPGGVDPVALAFKKHVTDEGMVLVKQAEDAASSKKEGKKDHVVGFNEQNFVRNLIDLHEKYLGYVETCFMSHALFHKSIKEAFEVFCNKDIAGHSSAELLATFCDNTLKTSGAEKLSEEEMKETLENVVRLLVYISDKDMFAEFYRKKLARRLMNDKTGNDENDRSILSKFKHAYGGQFTSKMEGMLTDMTLAKENENSLKEYLTENHKAHPGLTFTVSVLTTGFWPTFKSADINLPSEMVKCVETFRDFYQTKTKHRKLTWLFSLGTCHITAKFDAKSIELAVTTYQGAVLMLFNASDKLSFQEIMTQLNLPEDDVVRLLHSLSCAKYKFLIKTPETRMVSPTDVFEFNPKFTDKARKIKVPLPPVDDRKKVVEDVVKDRRYAVDAAIVRIMKSRKVLAYQNLVMECVEMLSRTFKPDVKLIKKRIEELINQDFLERDSQNPNMFKYLA